MRLDRMRMLLVVGALLLTMNGYVALWPLGFVGAVLFFGGAIVQLCRVRWLGEACWERLVFGCLGVFGAATILLDGMYLLTGRLDLWMVFVGLWVVTGLLFLFGSDRVAGPRFAREQPWFLSAMSVAASLVLVGLLWAARTDLPLVSPWNLFGSELFVLLFVAVVAAILAARERDDDLPVFVWMLAAFSALSVSAMVYAIGFGFDPFLHRAAEQALVNTGVVEPIRLLYSGQYVLVAAAHHLTAGSVKLIDIWLVPVLASVWLPVAVMLGFERGWGLSRRQARMWWVGILAIPFMLATFTVPFTLSYVFFLAFMVVYPYTANVSRTLFLVVLFALLASALFHPLLSVPLLMFIVGERWVMSRKRVVERIVGSIATVILIGLSVPSMLAVAANKTDSFWSLSRLTTNLGEFVRLFLNPYWDPYPYIPWALDVLYEFRYWWPMVAFVTAMVCLAWTKSLRGHLRSHLVFSIGLLGSIWGASTLFTFEGIIVHEQGEFALRLLQVLYTFSLPVLVVVLARWDRLMLGRATFWAVLVVIGWFFSYPQYNLKYPFFSPGVSADDVEGVHRIEEESQGEPYLVLSHQLMSAAAIQEYGFVHTYPYEGEEILWYAIPTGGPLYALYISTIHGGPSLEAYADMARQTGVRRIYFAAPSYWAWTPELLAELEEGADRILNQEGMTIYEFTSFHTRYENTDN